MFDFLQARPFVDATLGELRRSGRRWRGRLRLGAGDLPLAIEGPRRGPDAGALAAARDLPRVWAQQADAVARALAEHLAPYREAVLAGESEAPRTPLPSGSDPASIWASVELLSASVTLLDGQLMSEVALAVTWDEEHTLGARFHGAAFVELNGSIRPE
ncbi:hypothetical protein [Piscinibacter koreensis]|uniref:DUF2262 domain-containing protein n=1 Tax=Piscinibacter koreensis TaxID=2742824 RepID=A0A7Y6TVW2_9BURK|nr:hypothetical protein [Schlegelella koreensis]NUZ05361.1 hypothetical protein [Schlegelella koreensis]